VTAHTLEFDEKNYDAFRHPFAHAMKYARYLEITLSRSERIRPRLAEALEAIIASTKITPRLQTTLRRHGSLHAQYFREVESFYQFAFIFLDRLAQAIVELFGNPGIDRVSHNWLVDHLPEYARTLGLTQPTPSLNRQSSELRDKISRFRNNPIVHLNNPRIAETTVYSSDGEITMSFGPRRKEDQEALKGQERESQKLQVLKGLLDSYINELSDYVSQNISKVSGYKAPPGVEN
jgi:hypothetical protein